MHRRFFVEVDHAIFKRFINSIDNAKIKHTGYETVLYDGCGEIVGILHAASIDERGKCHPPAYYLNRTTIEAAQQSIKLRLVA